ncbi:MAG: hypothetical protein IJ371_04910 [Clostridia bacterium]|nr:hypothetical protein [Clostridia bacterium]
MKRKVSRIVSACVLSAFLGMVLFAVIWLLKDISIASILVSAGLVLMFGTPTIYLLGGIIVSFCGRKVIGQVVTSQYFSGGTDDFGHWQVGYIYTDMNGKMKFGTITCGHRHPTKTVFVRHWKIFHHAEINEEITQEEYDTYEWSNIKIEEAEKLYKKHNKKFWIFAPLLFVVAIVLIIAGAVLTM